VRIAVVGGGIAGALLTWRLGGAFRRVRVDLYVAGTADASGASGGLVRGFETDQALCRMAAESLAELRGSRLLREWAGYQEIGSVYVLPLAADLAGLVDLVHERIPGSARIASGEQLQHEYPFRDLPDGTVGVVERHAGYLSPGQFRQAVLASSSARIRRISGPITAVTTDPAVHLCDGRRVRYDAVVVAAGAWTPHLLTSSGLPRGQLRTKQIQYTLCAASLRGVGAFVDDTSGIYGRPNSADTVLVGLPGDRWDPHPEEVVPDPDLAARVLAVARTRLGMTVPPGAASRTVAAADCYHEPSGLALRRIVPGFDLFTFTGGSGGAAKTALAASRSAASALLSGGEDG
jgi:glycine/D-amino acid oxidase-like deaminating enzyme